MNQKQMKQLSLNSLLVAFFIAISIISTTAQNKQVVSCGEIIFEKKESTLRKLKENRDEDDGFWIDEMIKNSPKFTSSYFRLKFKDNESEYSWYDDKRATKQKFWGGSELAGKNIVYKNLLTSERTSLKQVFENDFIFKDSIRNFQWKLSNEFREIAGYDCRKATTIINDSLYVIAFYTDDMVLSTGPESFGGLPGTILGVVMPRLYVTWFATEVKTDCVFEKPITKPTKGKVATQSTVENQLRERFGKYKKWFQGLMWSMVI